MERDITAIAPTADAFTALQAMQEHGVGRLPVVDEAGNLIGIVSKTDLMTAFDVIQSREDATSVIGGSSGADMLTSPHSGRWNSSTTVVFPHCIAE